MEVRNTDSQRPVSSDTNPAGTRRTTCGLAPAHPPPLLWQLTADFLDWDCIRHLLHTQRAARQGIIDAPLSQWRRAAQTRLPGQGAAPFKTYDDVWRASLRYEIAQRSLAAGQPARQVRETFSGDISRSAWSPDGGHLAVAGGRDVRIWHRTRGLVAQTTHGGEIYALSWSPDGRWCASGGMDGILRVLDTKGTPEYTVPQVGRIYAARWSPDSTRVVATNSGPAAHIVDVTKQTATPIAHADAVTAAAWSPDGALLTTASSDGVARLCDGCDGAVRAWHQHRQGFFRTRDNLVDTSWSPDGTLAVNLGIQGSLSFFTPDGDVRAYEMGHYYHALTWSPDGQRLLLQGERGILSALVPWPLSDTPTTNKDGAKYYEVLKSTEIRDQNNARWSRDSAHLLCLQRHTLRVLGGDGEDEVIVDQLPTLPTFWDFCADGRFVAIGLSQPGLRIWDVQARKVRTVSCGSVHSAAWSPDGTWVAVASWDGNVYLVDASAPSQTPQACIQMGGSPSQISWSSDGTALRCTVNARESVVLQFAPG